MREPLYSSLYQINTRVWLTERSRALGRPATLDDVRSQCYVRLPFPELSGHTVRLKDQMGSASYDRDGGDLVSQGLYLDLPPWSYHVFEMSAV